jgi:hypothetical protein
LSSAVPLQGSLYDPTLLNLAVWLLTSAVAVHSLFLRFIKSKKLYLDQGVRRQTGSALRLDVPILKCIIRLLWTS